MRQALFGTHCRKWVGRRGGESPDQRRLSDRSGRGIYSGVFWWAKTSTFQPHHKYTDVCRRDAGDSRGLAQSAWANLDQFLSSFGSETWDGRIIEVGRNLFFFEGFKLGNFRFLTGNVPLVLDCDLHLLNGFPGKMGQAIRKIIIGDPRTSKKLRQRVSRMSGILQTSDLGFDRELFCFDGAVTMFREEPDIETNLG